MSEKNTSNNTPTGTPPRPQPSSRASSSSLGLPTSRPTVTPPSDNTNGSHQRSSSASFTAPTPKPTPSPKPTTNSRYNPPVPSRMSGTYSNNGSIYQNHGGNSMSNYGASRLGSHSASNSPPGTPPNGLRNYYLNAAMHRSQGHHLYPGSAHGSPHGSSTNLALQQQQPQRPSISITVPSNSNTTVPSVTMPRRSYSADQLTIDEPEITVTTPGGSNATEEHVMTLQKALSNLIEKELREEGSRRGSVIQEGDEDEDDADGPIMMKGSSEDSKGANHRRGNSTSAASEKASAAHTGGISVTPRVLAHRLDPEAVESSMTHGVIGSDVTLGGLDVSEKEKKLKDKKKGHNRITRLFHKEATDRTAVPDQIYQMGPSGPVVRAPVLPSKGGVLSNLLKLQGNNRHHKVRAVQQNSLPTSKMHKEKKKRPALYSKSANTSATDLVSKSVFGTYPPLPKTMTQGSIHGSTTGMATLSANVATHRNGSGHRHSFQFEGGTFAASFPPGNSPIQSPNGSPRGSFSCDNTLSNGSLLGSLSAEEKMRITFAVADILQRQDYVLRLARAMIKYGAPSHRLEDAVDHTARTLELNLQCVYLPNVMIVAFTDYETHTSETHLLKCPAGLDMYKFAQVHQVLKMVTHASMPVEEAIMKLDAINTEKDLWPRWANILSYALASFCTAPMFFKGSWVDAGVSFAIGATVGLMNWLSEKVPSYAHIVEVTMSVFVAFVAEALHAALKDKLCMSAVKMAGIVILLPGYTITCSILELSSRHMISGSVRLFYAIIFSLLLGYGLTIGASIWLMIDPTSDEGDAGEVTSACPTSLDPKWNILFVPVFACTLLIWLKAHPRQFPLAVFLSTMGYAVSYSISTYTSAGTDVSSAMASFSIGFSGNVYQRVTHQLTFQAVVCAIFFLVPGSMGLKGAMAWFTNDMAGGVNFALQMVITAIAISVGLFASALVVYPMGKARSAQMTF
ncbi:hypothetical protein EMPS_02042 [Entomortierella parvispora]|uniref:DUF1212-domain-containing protein n=1 Tax=Entomortierella parvispora TaxID=205924 RepID=A0A9P3H448_9FUNG|nr:hypothetical protein EMPS_02042 [Entomortierella parvispora]